MRTESYAQQGYQSAAALGPVKILKSVAERETSTFTTDHRQNCYDVDINCDSREFVRDHIQPGDQR